MISRTTLAVIAVLGLAARIGAEPTTYVSVEGSDTADCSRATPCRTFAGALPRTDPGGTVVAIDSGLFSDNHLDVRQPVTLEAAPGAHVLLQSKDFGAISINASPDERVILRGLTLVATGDARPLHGIVHNGATELQVENCVVRGFPSSGIHSLGSRLLSVQDTVIQGSDIAVFLDAAGDAVFERVRLADNEYGIVAGLGARATIRNSVVTGSRRAGLRADGFGHRSELNVVDCVVTHNALGVGVVSYDRVPAVLRLSNNTITDNDTGVSQTGTGAVAESRGNNTIRGNAVDVSGVLTLVAGR